MLGVQVHTEEPMRRITFMILLLPLMAPVAQAAPLALGEGSVVWLEGDSTLHKYSSTATALNLAAEAGSDSASDLLKEGTVGEFRLEVDVEGLKSGKNQLDRKMYESLDSKNHPLIVFRLTGYQTSPAGLSAKGTLTVAGKDKEIVLLGRTKATPGGLEVTGSHDLFMSDFGIKPPKMFMGALKTDDRVTVHFRVVLAPAR
jgi:hypothetical protein